MRYLSFQSNLKKSKLQLKKSKLEVKIKLKFLDLDFINIFYDCMSFLFFINIFYDCMSFLFFKNRHITTSLLENADFDVKFLEESFHNDLVKVVFGHHVDENTLTNFINKKYYFYTFIRDPVSRIVSHFLFDKEMRTIQNREILTFEQFYKSNPKNPICDWLINKFPTAIQDTNASISDQCISILNIFNFIGSTHDFNVKTQLLLRDIGIKKKIISHENVSSNNHEKDEILKKYSSQIKEDNFEDQRLYNLYLKNSNDMNPFGFNSTRHKKFINDLSKRKNTKKILANNYSNAISEYRNFNAEKREMDRAIKNLEFALLKCKVFSDKLKDSESKDKILSIIKKFERDQ